MKVLLSFVCVLLSLAVVRADDDKVAEVVSKFGGLIEREGKECFDEAGVTPDELEKLKLAKEDDLEKEEIKELVSKFGCLMACIHKNHGTMKDSQLDGDKIDIEIDKELANAGEDERAAMKKISAECIEEVKGLEDECAIGAIYTMCTIKKMVE